MKLSPLKLFGKDLRGNALMIYALAMPALALTIGIAIDFGRAAQLRTKLNAVADAAALAALTPAMMAQNDSTAQAAAAAMFNGQAQALISANSVGLASATPTVTVTTPATGSRSVSVCYSAAETTMFAGALGQSSLSMSNCVAANVTLPPNIDFYVLLDNSPSMALPATAAGIAQMQTLTPWQDPVISGSNVTYNGCAFACHQASTNNGDTSGNTCADGTSPTVKTGYKSGSATYYVYTCSASHGAQIDNYQLARNNNITLRIDELNSGLSALLQDAYSIQSTSAAAPQPSYRFSISSMDSLWSVGFTNLMSLTGNYVSGWSSASANFGVMEDYSNNYDCANSACSSGKSASDEDTNFDNALSSINALMPSPGGGTAQATDSPQEVLFFVTDGVEDENSSGSRLIQQINGGNSTNYCDTIKARGIKIAILYTQYLAVPANPYYQAHVAPILTNIAPALQACASPNLFIEAAIGDDIATDLLTLFNKASQRATLTQ